MKLLIVRPQPGADATAARVRVAGHEALVVPLFAIEPMTWDAPDASAYDAILLTSGNAVRMAGPQLQDLRWLPVYAVGAATAAALNEAGIDAIATGASGVEQLLAMAETNGYQNLLWLAGEDRTGINPPLAMMVDALAVYRSAVLAEPPGFAAGVNQADAVMLHSARAARHFSETCHTHMIERSCVTLAALSPKIAEAAQNGWHAVVVSPEPNDSSLLSALQRHFTTPSRDP